MLANASAGKDKMLQRKSVAVCVSNSPRRALRLTIAEVQPLSANLIFLVFKHHKCFPLFSCGLPRVLLVSQSVRRQNMFSSNRSAFCLSTKDCFIWCQLTLQDGVVCSTHTIGRLKDIPCSDAVSHCISPSGKYACLTDTSKKTVLLTHESGILTPLGFTYLPRCASCMCFSPDEKYVIFGERSGNVYKLAVSDFTGLVGKSESLSLMLGHLSILSDVTVSDDCTLIATCDRDEKIRISRFSQPFVIEAFCLGHESFITQLVFCPRSHYLVSAGGDSFLRLWEAQTGLELATFQLSFPECAVTSDCTTDPAVVVSRLICPVANLCVGCSSSHPVLFAIPFQIRDEGTSVTCWGSMTHVVTPNTRPLLDLAVCSPEGEEPHRLLLIGLSMDALPKLITWSLAGLSIDNKVPPVIDWQQLNVVSYIPEDLLELPDPNPRLEFLKSLHKTNHDRSMIESYEENKPIHHQKVLDRRLRHQQKRQSRKRLKRTIDT
ncbi:hypothetical protein EG68_07269 [Paragonimus skrjabini miyazakii]|uniref:tRNA (guanine-N(7)-)-methyltransferase non-catalytic subunit n=1 Tax=Paragonimus skrjabini miyazakii TaxID=59628 RepID=A0A8S9YRB8_9TREM|nr:hypothetical protein EG68_07269 [Paragonimus skrjabini miyazakii]